MDKKLKREDLAAQESQVLDLLARHLGNKEIGQKLSISPETVKSHLSSLYRSLNCENRREAVRNAREMGLFDTPGLLNPKLKISTEG